MVGLQRRPVQRHDLRRPPARAATVVCLVVHGQRPTNDAEIFFDPRNRHVGALGNAVEAERSVNDQHRDQRRARRHDANQYDSDAECTDAHFLAARRVRGQQIEQTLESLLQGYRVWPAIFIGAFLVGVERLLATSTGANTQI